MESSSLSSDALRRDNLGSDSLSRQTTPPSRLRNLSDPDSLREFARNLREGIYITSRDGRILDANPAFLEMFGVRTVADLRAQGAGDLLVDAHRRAEEMELVDRDGSIREFEITIRRANGEVRTALNTAYLTRDAMTGEEFLHGILIDITARKALEARLVEMSTHDPLTGVLNRRHLLELERVFDADPLAQWGCIFVDIDHFKIYNDRYGHQSGDLVLIRMARFLMRHVRVEESLVRMGGDEFVVLLRDADSPATELVADRLRVEALLTAPVPFSLGWAAREPGETLTALLDRADHGLMAVRVEKRHSDPRDHPAVAGD